MRCCGRGRAVELDEDVLEGMELDTSADGRLSPGATINGAALAFWTCVAKVKVAF